MEIPKLVSCITKYSIVYVIIYFVNKNFDMFGQFGLQLKRTKKFGVRVAWPKHSQFLLIIIVLEFKMNEEKKEELLWNFIAINK